MSPSPDHLMPHAVTLLERAQDGPSDEYGDPTWTELEQGTRANLQPIGSREEYGGAVQVATWRCFLPADAPARGWDALRLDADDALLGLPAGTVFELEGDAGVIVNPRLAARSHVEAYVRKVE